MHRQAAAENMRPVGRTRQTQRSPASSMDMRHRAELRSPIRWPLRRCYPHFSLKDPPIAAPLWRSHSESLLLRQGAGRRASLAFVESPGRSSASDQCVSHRGYPVPDARHAAFRTQPGRSGILRCRADLCPTIGGCWTCWDCAGRRWRTVECSRRPGNSRLQGRASTTLRGCGSGGIATGSPDAPWIAPPRHRGRAHGVPDRRRRPRCRGCGPGEAVSAR